MYTPVHEDQSTAATPQSPVAVRVRLEVFVGGSSSGRTADSDSAYRGSNPRPPANASFAGFRRLSQR